jgi:hypothetical protein
MSRIGFSTNTETLLFLGYAARAGLREAMQAAYEKQRDEQTRKRILCDRVMSGSPPVFEGTYGPVYKTLFEYRLSLVEFNVLEWALRGYNAVYLKESTDENEDTPETDLVFQSIGESEQMLALVKRLGRHSNVRRLSNQLRLHFTFRQPLIMRTTERAFLIQEFIAMSLERVNWAKLASLVIGVPYTPLQDDGKEGDYEAMQLALLKELLWRGSVDFGEFGNHPLFTRPIHEICLDLADHCLTTQAEVHQQEDQGLIYEP